MTDYIYSVVFNTRDGLQEIYEYARAEDARYHLDLFRDGSDADLYESIEMRQYCYLDAEEITLETIEF